MAFVLDASMAISWYLADESASCSSIVLDALVDTHAEVPPLWPFEIANVLAVNEKKRRITDSASFEFLLTLSRLDIRIDRSQPAIDGNALLPLVRRHGLTACDAAYLELAKRKGLALATLDKELIVAAKSDGCALVGQPA